jgi:hypothetical protein
MDGLFEDMLMDVVHAAKAVGYLTARFAEALSHDRDLAPVRRGQLEEARTALDARVRGMTGAYRELGMRSVNVRGSISHKGASNGEGKGE